MRTDAAFAEPLLESLVRRWVSPTALFAGAAAAFLACSMAGWVASSQSPYEGFVRAHPQIAPEGSFHPTVSQLRAVVAERAPRGSIVVIVGGSSVLHGVGQSRDQVWTRRLQERLGERFRVFNLAFRGGGYSEGGAVVAESLIKNGWPVIYVGDTTPATTVPPVRGFRYEYMLWDAYEKRLLFDDPTREARLNELIGRFDGPEREALGERRLGAWLDRPIRFNDLWTTAGYRWIFTVWNFLARDRPFAPRKVFVDSEFLSVPPLNRRYPRSNLEFSLRIARSFAEGHIARDAKGPAADPALPRWQAFRNAIEVDLPLELRQRTLMVIDGQSPYYLSRLTPEERLLYDLVVARTVTILRETGSESVAVGPGFTVDDFYDRVHLTPAGGTRLADTVAPIIRDMAYRLGYTR
jgi:hypothetical protein